MVGCIYKIISKIMTFRLKKIIHMLIEETQNSFVTGKQISDGALIVLEVVNCLKQRKKEGVILKLDFTKAYDSVEWEFILEVLEVTGFGEKWRQWVKECISSPSISILLNGYLRGLFPSV